MAASVWLVAVLRGPVRQSWYGFVGQGRVGSGMAAEVGLVSVW